MSKRNIPAELVFSKGQSRNMHDHTLVTLSNGRKGFAANGKGVRYRASLLVTFIANHPGCNANEMVAHLQTFSESYQASDLSAPLAQLRKTGLLHCKGRTRDMTYSLSANAKAIWASINKVFK